MNEELYNLIYARANEVQPQIQTLVKNLQNDGLSPDKIIIEVSFALINEGYQLRELASGIKISTHNDETSQIKIEDYIEDKLCESSLSDKRKSETVEKLPPSFSEAIEKMFPNIKQYRL